MIRFLWNQEKHPGPVMENKELRKKEITEMISFGNGFLCI
jgi:hypothetical protein